MRLLTPEEVNRLPDERRKQYLELQAQLAQTLERDPLQRFHSCKENCGLPGCVVHPKQAEFLAAQTKIQAAFAGNRFGKTTALVVKALCQHYPTSQLPSRLQPFKVVKHDNPVMGRLMCPSEKALHGYFLPKLREWAPRQLLVGEAFDKAWSKQKSVLFFKDGGQIEVLTYAMDADKLVGAALDYVGYDEPPPQEHRNENMARLIDRNGFEFYALTPVNMTGGGIGWLYREIWKKKHEPYLTVVQGAIHDNVTLDPESIAFTLAQYSEEERRAREHGEFLNFGGMVFPGGFEKNLCKPATPDHVKDWDVVVGIDPGLKNAAFVWVGFDSDNVAYVFDEVLLQEKTPADYANAIHRVNAKWGIASPTYVIDPSARNRSLVNAENVESLLAQRGIYCVHGQNQVEPGVQQVRLRLQRKRLYIAENCRGLRDEAEEYRMQDRPDGEFKVVKENDHRLDALRYVAMYRLYDPLLEQQERGGVHWEPGKALSAKEMQALAGSLQGPGNPLGSMV